MAVLNIDDDMSRGNPRAVIVRAEVRSMAAYYQQLYHDLRRGPQPGYVDGTRSHLNTTIVAYKKGRQLRDICNTRRSKRATSRKLKSNAGVAVIGLIGFGIEAQEYFKSLSPGRQLAAYRRIARAIAERANTTLEGLVVHADETAPHAHFVLAGYNMDGEPLSGLMKKGMLSDFQSIAAEEIQRFEKRIERGRRRWERLEAGASYAETIHKSVRQLHAEIPADLAAAERRRAAALTELDHARSRVEYASLEAEVAEQRRTAALEAAASAEDRRDAAASKAEALQIEVTRLQTLVKEAQEKADKNQRLADKARADLERHQSEATKVQQIAKRLATYERREGEAKAAVQQAEARLTEVKRDVAEIAAGATSLVAEAAGGTLQTDVWGGIQLQDPTPLRQHPRELMPLAEALVSASRRNADLADREKAVAARERDLDERAAEVELLEKRVEAAWSRMSGLFQTLKRAIEWVGDSLGLRLPDNLATAVQEISGEIENRARNDREIDLSM